jgi:hypothetical protein
MKEIAATRTQRPAGLLAARGLIAAASAKRRPLVVAGAYDKTAIMAAAVAARAPHVRALRFLNAIGALLAAVVLIGGGMSLIGLASHL